MPAFATNQTAVWVLAYNSISLSFDFLACKMGTLVR